MKAKRSTRSDESLGLHSFLHLISGYFRGRPVIIDGDISSLDLIEFTARKSIAYLRGVIRFRRLILCESDVKIICGRNIALANGMYIERGVRIDAFGCRKILFGKNVKLGRNGLVLGGGSIARKGKGIVLGNDVGVGEYFHIGGSGGISIGDDTIIGPYVSMHAENHKFLDQTKKIREQGVERLGINIGANCWIGAKAVILDGVNLGVG